MRILTHQSQPPINIAIRVAVELGLFEVIDASGRGSITAREIAKTQNVDELLVGTLMPLRYMRRECLPTLRSSYNARPHGRGYLRRVWPL